MKIISFFSFKGGVGRTALLLNLGAHWASEGKVVALADMDLFAPGLTYNSIKGNPIFPDGMDQGISDILAAFYERDPKSDKFNFLPPSMLLKEMHLQKKSLKRRGGRLLLLDAGKKINEVIHRKRNEEQTNLDYNWEDGQTIPQIKTAETEETSEENQAFRQLARYIREDLSEAKLPSLEKEGQFQKIDYLLIDTRTGFPELLDLSLGYLADQMVLVSGINDQNLRGLQETFQALHLKVPIDTLPLYVSLVFSPIPSNEDFTLLKHLKEVNKKVRSFMRITSSGEMEQLPAINYIHYTSLLSMSEAPLALDLPESTYAGEIRDIASNFEPLPAKERGFNFKFTKRAEAEAQSEFFQQFEFKIAPAIQKNFADKNNGILQDNPFASPPPWHWPLENLDQKTMLLERLIQPNSELYLDRERFLSKLHTSFKLNIIEKEIHLDSFSTSTENEINEQLKSFDDQKVEYLKSWQEQPEDREQIISFAFKKYRDWARLLLQDDQLANHAFYERPFLQQGAFRNWEKDPLFWIVLAKEHFQLYHQENRVKEAVEYGIKRITTKKKEPLVFKIIDILGPQYLPTDLFLWVADQALSLLKEPQRLSLEVASQLIKLEKTRDLGLQKLNKILSQLNLETFQDAKYLSDLGEVILFEAKEKIEACEDVLQKSIELDPNNSNTFYCLAVLKMKHLGKFQEAELGFNKAIEISPHQAHLWFGLGNLYLGSLKKVLEAEKAYKKAIELNPKVESAWNNLGNLYRKSLQRYSEAEEAYKRAIEIRPEAKIPWNNLGNLYANNLQRYSEAEEAYKKAIDINPKYEYAWNNLGNLYANNLQRYSDAEESYKKAIEINPENQGVWNSLGDLYTNNLQRYSDAEESYKKVIEINPKYELPWDNLSNLYAEHLQQYSAAERTMKRVIELNPQNCHSWNSLGLLYCDYIMDYKKAEEAFLAGLKVSINPLLKLNLSRLKIQLQEFEEGETLHQKTYLLFTENVRKSEEPTEQDLVCALMLALECRDEERIAAYSTLIKEEFAETDSNNNFLFSYQALSKLVIYDSKEFEKCWALLKQKISSYYDHFKTFWVLYNFARYYPELLEKLQTLALGLFEELPELSKKYKDQPRPERVLQIYRRFAEGKSKGLGDPKDLEIIQQSTL